jgi:hypothetical protein
VFSGVSRWSVAVHGGCMVVLLSASTVFCVLWWFSCVFVAVDGGGWRCWWWYVEVVLDPDLDPNLRRSVAEISVDSVSSAGSWAWLLLTPAMDAFSVSPVAAFFRHGLRFSFRPASLPVFGGCVSSSYSYV